MATHLTIRPYFDGESLYRIVSKNSIESINYYVNDIILPNSYEKNKSIISFSSKLQDKRCVVSNGLVSVMADKNVKVLLFDNGIIAFYNAREVVFTLDLITFKKYSLSSELDGYILSINESYIHLTCGKIFFNLDVDFSNSLLPFKFKLETLKLDNM